MKGPHDRIDLYTSLAKVAMVLGLMTSLIGGIAPRLTKADGTINVIVRGEANVCVGFGEAKVTRKTTLMAEQTAKAKNSTKAKVMKGKQTMTTINSDNNGVGKASSLPGE
jgi:hypothetical protein